MRIDGDFRGHNGFLVSFPDVMEMIEAQIFPIEVPPPPFRWEQPEDRHHP